MLLYVDLLRARLGPQWRGKKHEEESSTEDKASAFLQNFPRFMISYQWNCSQRQASHPQLNVCQN